MKGASMVSNYVGSGGLLMARECNMSSCKANDRSEDVLDIMTRYMDPLSDKDFAAA